MTSRRRSDRDARNPLNQQTKSRQLSENREGPFKKKCVQAGAFTLVDSDVKTVTRVFDQESRHQKSLTRPLALLRSSSDSRRRNPSQWFFKRSGPQCDPTISRFESTFSQASQTSEKKVTDSPFRYGETRSESKNTKRRHFQSLRKKNKKKDEDLGWEKKIQIIPVTQTRRPKVVFDRSMSSDGMDDVDPGSLSALLDQEDLQGKESDISYHEAKSDDDESRRSKMEFSTGDLSDLSFPPIQDADFEQKLFRVFGGKLTIDDSTQNIHTMVQNLGESKTPITAENNWRNAVDQDKLCPAPDVQEDSFACEDNERDFIVPTGKKSFCEAELPLSTTLSTQKNSITKSTSVKRDPPPPQRETTCQQSASVEQRGGRGALSNVTSVSVDKQAMIPDRAQADTSALESRPVDKVIAQEEPVDLLGREKKSIQANAKQPSHLVFDDVYDASPMDCSCAAFLANALYFVTAPMFDYAFGDSERNRGKGKIMSLEEEEELLLEVYLSDFASKEEKKKALTRLLEVQRNEENFADLAYGSSFESSCTSGSVQTNFPETNIGTSPTKTLPLEAKVSTKSSENLSSDKYAPLKKGEGIDDDTSQPRSVHMVSSTNDSTSDVGSDIDSMVASLSETTRPLQVCAEIKHVISPKEMEVLKKHAKILGVDLQVLIDARTKGNETTL